MFRTALKHLPLILVIIISLAFVGFALAHESDDPAHIEAHARAEASVSVDAQPKPVKPIDLLRAKANEIKQTVDAAAQRNATQTSDEKRDVMKNAWEERRDRTTTAKGAARFHADLIKERFTLAIRQFDKMIARIESRVAKMRAEGIATASVEARLETAKTAQANAKADIQAVADFVARIDESADRAQVRAELQILIRTAHASVKSAHQALQAAVRSLVALAKESGPEASGAASVETEAAVTTE